jgi:hypothetical protein
VSRLTKERLLRGLLIVKFHKGYTVLAVYEFCKVALVSIAIPTIQLDIETIAMLAKAKFICSP